MAGPCRLPICALCRFVHNYAPKGLKSEGALPFWSVESNVCKSADGMTNDVSSWGWYVPTTPPGYSILSENNLDASLNGLVVDPAGYVEVTLRDANYDGIINDNDLFDGSITDFGEYVIGPSGTFVPDEVALYTGGTITIAGTTYTDIDMVVTLFTDGTYAVRIMDYDIPPGIYSDVTYIELGTWNGVEYSGVTLSGVDQPFVCFAAGTRVETPDGPKRVERLQVGDMVLTRDHGPQTVRWVANRHVPGQGPNAPVRIPVGALGNDRIVELSPQHRVMVAGPKIDLYFNTPEVLVRAKDLVGVNGISYVRRPVAHYVHFACDRHEVVTAHNMPIETFYPGPEARSILGQGAFDHFTDAVGGLAAYGPIARPVLSGAEAQVLAGLLAQRDAVFAPQTQDLHAPAQ